MLPIRSWVRWPPADSASTSSETQAPAASRAIWARVGNSGGRHSVDVVRTIDGDTFEARVLCGRVST